MAQVRPEDLLILKQTQDSNPRLAEYLTRERDFLVKTLTLAADSVAIHRCQGAIHHLNTLIENLTNASLHLKKLAATQHP